MPSTAPSISQILADFAARFSFEQIPPEGLYEIEVPFPIPENAIAFEVEGDSMWPRYDPGDIILCWREGADADDVVGWEAAVRTADGKRYLKRIRRGAVASSFDLESHNAAPIRGVLLEWAAQIQADVRAGQWRRFAPGQRKVKDALPPAPDEA